MSTESQSRFVRGVMSMGASTLITLVSGFLGLTIVARRLPPADFGVYFLILAIVALLEVIGDFGLRMATAQFIASTTDEEEKQRLVNTIMMLRILGITAVALLSIIAKPLLLRLYPSDLLSSMFLYVPIIFAVQLLESTLAAIMQGFYLYRKMAIIKTTQGVLNFVLLLVFVLLLDIGVEGVLLAYVCSLGVAAIMRQWMLPQRIRPVLDIELSKRLYRFGINIQGNAVLSFIFQQVDVLILGALLGPAYVAYLEVGAKIPNYFRRLFQSVNDVYFPHMSELFGQDKYDDAANVMNNFLRIIVFLVLFCTMGAVLFGQEIIVLVFSAEYLPSVPIFGILMFTLSIGIASQIFDVALISVGRPIYLIGINLVTAAASVIANIALIPSLGAIGVALARLASTAIANPVSVWCVLREKIAARVLVYIKPMLIFGLCLLPYFFLGWQSLPLKVVLLGLYIVLSLAASVVTLHDTEILLRSFRFKSVKSLTNE